MPNDYSSRHKPCAYVAERHAAIAKHHGGPSIKSKGSAANRPPTTLRKTADELNMAYRFTSIDARSRRSERAGVEPMVIIGQDLFNPYAAHSQRDREGWR